MPGYPRMDIGNPYLTARYDGRIVDSLPWGRGWLADGSVVRSQKQNTVVECACVVVTGRAC